MMMDIKSTTDILNEIRQPTSLERQINALKLLKHDIIGNQLRKDAWKDSELLQLLAAILVSPSVSTRTWRGDEGKVILHAVTIVASLAYGEPDYVEALEASHIFGGLVRALEAVETNSAIVLAALRALNNIADSIALRINGARDQALAAAIYSDNGQKNLRRVVWQSKPDTTSFRQTVLAARLLSKTCVTEARRAQAVSSGFLGALALTVGKYGPRCQSPRSSAPNTSMGLILRAIATVIAGSSERAYDFAQLHLDQGRTISRANGHARPSKTQATDSLFGWLLQLVKKESGSVRLMAIWIVTIYLRTTYQDPDTTNTVASALVPMLVQMLEQPSSHAQSDLYPDDERQLMADAPRVLALLVSEDSALQEAAFEAGAVSKLSKLLRHANEAIPKDRSKAFWHCQKGHIEPRGATLPPALSDQWMFREAVLQALAAVASQHDDYRKAVVESGAVVSVVECLKPLDVEILTQQQRNTAAGEMIRSVGNPVPVLLAACEAAKSLSRSVSTLRTSLVDANLATPLAVLLKHPDLEVKIGATAVICNIVLEFSPMRQAAVDAGVIRLLCQHAHSSDARLKLNSLWALKHAVHSAPNSLKLQCVAALGPGWLRQALEQSFGAPVLPSIANLTGEGPSLFNTRQFDEDEVHMIDSPTDSQSWTEQTGPGTDDLAIREQALNFIRNLISGDGSYEMVDYIIRDVGQDRLFDMLGSLLSGNDSDVILAVLYIICNLAAGTPRHRQILVSQENLLRLVAPMFQHPRAEIRSACVWLMINLTWEEDHDDRLGCKSRAIELRKIGMVDKLEILAGDADLDVRERTKTALHQIRLAVAQNG